MEDRLIGVLKEFEGGSFECLTKDDSELRHKDFNRLFSLGLIEYHKGNKHTYHITKEGERALMYESIDEYMKQDGSTKQEIVIKAKKISNSTIYQSFDKAIAKPITHTTNNTQPNKPPKKSPIEVIAWIVGIIAGLIAIFQFWVK